MLATVASTRTMGNVMSRPTVLLGPMRATVRVQATAVSPRAASLAAIAALSIVLLVRPRDAVYHISAVANRSSSFRD
jgi:hypothetical protein